MDSKDFKSLQEAYSQVQENNQLNEYSAFLGGKIGGGERSVTVGGSAGGFGGSATFGTRRAKNTDDAAKASVTNALADVQNKERSDTIVSRNSATSAAKPTAKPVIKPGATGAAALGGSLSLSSAQKSSADANRAPLPTAVAKVSEPETKNVRFATGSFSGSAGGSQKPATPSRPAATKPTGSTPIARKPTDIKGPDTRRPMDVKGPDMVRRPMDVKGPDMVRKPEDFVKKPEFDRRPMTGGGDMIRREQLAYYQLLNYLLDEGYASNEESADKIILNMSESWFEDIMELNRYEKETGKDYKTGKKVTKGGTMGGDDTHSQVMRHMHKVMGAGRMGAGGPIEPRGKKKEKGKKPPKAGEYGGPRSPEQKVKMRRAQKQASQDMMHSRYD